MPVLSYMDKHTVLSMADERGFAATAAIRAGNAKGLSQASVCELVYCYRF